MAKKKKSTGEIIFACGKKYTEVLQSVIDQLHIGEKFCVWKNEGNTRSPEPRAEISCLDCPCKRRAKRKQDMFFHKDDIDPKTDEAIHRPTGIVVQCAIAELKKAKKV